MIDNTQVDLKFVADLAVKAAAGDISTVINHEDVGTSTGKPFTLIPAGMTVLDLEPYMRQPLRIRQNLVLDDMASFVKYVRDFKAPETKVFFADKGGKFTAFLDYHRSGESLQEDSIDGGASWRTHVAEFPVRMSREWAAWTCNDRKPVSQLTFAEFLEENVKDCLAPSGAEILEMVETFQATRDVAFSSKVQRTSGGVQFSYTEENKAGSSEMVEFYKKMRINIPIIFGEPAQEIDLRLKWRIRENQLSLWYEMVDRAYILERAFVALIGKIENAETGLGIQILRGVAA